MNRAGAFETIVGLVVIGVAAAFLFYAYGASGQKLGGDQYRLDAVFGRIDGITIGSEVRIAGVKVGAVSSNRLDTDTYEATVQMTIDAGVPVPDDSVAKIVSDGLLGGAHVAIEPGASEEFLGEGERITITRGSVDLLNLAVQAFTNSPSGGGADNDAGAADDPFGDL
ncbi:MAG: outer membrane lipid asymmetry maintenance protein MlaD [Pseudomonadota bacterium]